MSRTFRNVPPIRSYRLLRNDYIRFRNIKNDLQLELGEDYSRDLSRIQSRIRKLDSRVDWNSYNPIAGSVEPNQLHHNND